MECMGGKSSIFVEKDDRKVNAKSLLGVLSLVIAKGMTIKIEAEGQVPTFVVSVSSIVAGV